MTFSHWPTPPFENLSFGKGIDSSCCEALDMLVLIFSLVQIYPIAFQIFMSKILNGYINTYHDVMTVSCPMGV